jgi:hypothetical protein
LKRLFKDALEGIHLWITDAFQRVIECVPPEQCFHSWKSEVRQRLPEDGAFVREQRLGGHAFWRSNGNRRSRSRSSS